MAIPWCPAQQIEAIAHSFKPDIIHTHHPFLLGPAAHKVARRLGIPIVFTHHTLYDEFEQAAQNTPLPTWFSTPLIRHTVRTFCNYVDAVIAPSIAVKETLLDKKIYTPISVIPSPIRTAFADNFTARNEPPSLQPIRLIVVGRLTPEKRIGWILKTVAKLPPSCPAKLHIIGNGPEYETLMNQAQAIKSDVLAINFSKQLPLEEILAAYRAADLLLFASTIDTQGLVLSEAMASGVPVLAVRNPGSLEIINEGHNGFFIDSPDDAARMIKMLVKLPQTIARLRGNALITGRSYLPEQIVSQLIALYHQTMNQALAHLCPHRKASFIKQRK